MSHKEEAENQSDHPSDLEESIRCNKGQVHLHPKHNLSSAEPSAAQEKPGFCKTGERLSQSSLPKNLQNREHKEEQ